MDQHRAAVLGDSIISWPLLSKTHQVLKVESQVGSPGGSDSGRRSIILVIHR